MLNSSCAQESRLHESAMNLCEFIFETDDPIVKYSMCWKVDMPCNTVELDRAV